MPKTVEQLEKALAEAQERLAAAKRICQIYGERASDLHVVQGYTMDNSINSDYLFEELRRVNAIAVKASEAYATIKREVEQAELDLRNARERMVG